MSKLDRQFYEDRAMRDAAREVLMADIAHAKASLSGKSIAGRITGRIGDGAKDVFEVAKTQGEDNRGIIAVLLGALILWLTRGPILEILGLEPVEEIEDAAQETADEAANDPEADSEPLQEEADIREPPPIGDTHD
uniref:hypothetical protein n=1 Tax=uncultured Erythrobacter sp. TaxID=263913 RepID=UPI002627CD0D|nr:hypothetical protein [uncultured Erythrobacter sp.]